MISFTAIVLLAPLLIAVAVLVRLGLGSPVLFTQVRPGLHERPFRMIKFRSMTDVRDSSGQLLPDEQRLTAFGRFLRASSLDELPELWNVLLGNMSIVGPRPLLMEYLPMYSQEQRRRHETRPGITGWAQVNGRNAIRWEQKFELDVWYVDNCSLVLDAKIILLTIWRVLRREGVSPADELVMPHFTGSRADTNRACPAPPDGSHQASCAPRDLGDENK
ncbi:MAG: sugar transferase [Steroidobacteraceae bacterium]